MPSHCVLLMRHVAGFKSFHSGAGDEGPSAEYPALLAKGVQEARAVAERLRETLDELPPDHHIRVCAVLHAPGPEPTATARIVSQLAGLNTPKAWPPLLPSSFYPLGGPDAAERL